MMYQVCYRSIKQFLCHAHPGPDAHKKCTWSDLNHAYISWNYSNLQNLKFLIK